MFFNFQDIEISAASEVSSDQNIKLIQQNSLAKIEKEILNLSDIKVKFISSIDKIFHKSFEPLSSYRLIKSSLNLGTQVREVSSKKITSKIITSKNKVVKKLNDLFVRLLYKKSEGLLFAQKIYRGIEKEAQISEELIRQSVLVSICESRKGVRNAMLLVELLSKLFTFHAFHTPCATRHMLRNTCHATRFTFRAPKVTVTFGSDCHLFVSEV